MSITYHILGLMSGTSLDGLDMALCKFQFDQKWSFELIAAETIRYDDQMHAFLSSAYSTSGEELARRHAAFGTFSGQRAKEFLQKNKLQADFISSHGHTIFHQPAKGFTFQLGKGAAIAAAAGLPVVYDFRSKDVALGGQGAPLVPIGDRLLFSDFDFCLNLGGIANISFEKNEKRIAYDISPCNLILNHLAAKEGKQYDEDGKLAEAGIVNEELLGQLNNWNFYTKAFPKSLGREDIDQHILPLLDKSNLSIADLSATVCRHIAVQIAKNCEGKDKKILITGGGAFHPVLIREIRQATDVEVIIPEASMINFKEAIIFAFLGALRLTNQINTLSSVTGAKLDSVGGVITA